MFYKKYKWQTKNAIWFYCDNINIYDIIIFKLIIKILFNNINFKRYVNYSKGLLHFQMVFEKETWDLNFFFCDLNKIFVMVE